MTIMYDKLRKIVGYIKSNTDLFHRGNHGDYGNPHNQYPSKIYPYRITGDSSPANKYGKICTITLPKLSSSISYDYHIRINSLNTSYPGFLDLKINVNALSTGIVTIRNKVYVPLNALKLASYSNIIYKVTSETSSQISMDFYINPNTAYLTYGVILLGAHVNNRTGIYSISERTAIDGITFYDQAALVNISTLKQAVTFANTGDLVTLTAHGLAEGTKITFTSLSGVTGDISNNYDYYVKYVNANTFQLSATAGGGAITLTADGAGDLTPIKVPPVFAYSNSDSGSYRDQYDVSWNVNSQAIGEPVFWICTSAGNPGTNLAVGEIDNAPRVVSKDFAGGHADWTLSSTQKSARILVVSNADAGANIIAPAEVRTYIVQNDTTQTITVKKSAGTGATVATGKRAMFMYDSVAGDYIRLWTT